VLILHRLFVSFTFSLMKFAQNACLREGKVHFVDNLFILSRLHVLK
jgi:hypothetical protein